MGPKSDRQKSRRPKSKRPKSRRPKSKRPKSKRPKSKRPKSKKPKSKNQRARDQRLLVASERAIGTWIQRHQESKNVCLQKNRLTAGNTTICRSTSKTRPRISGNQEKPQAELLTTARRKITPGILFNIVSVVH